MKIQLGIMKERPILFNTEMVRAVLEGRKTQTRRVMKPQPEYRENTSVPGNYGTFFHGWNLDHEAFSIADILKHCPYGKPGDELWVRETWKPEYWSNCGMVGINYKATRNKIIDKRVPKNYFDYYDNKWYDEAYNNGFHDYSGNGKIHLDHSSQISWKPSIHMPRWASRIQLRIKNIRVERVMDISEDDCEAEGLKLLQGGIKAEFMVLWDSIYKDRGLGWAVNPWVWVVEFERVK